MVSVSPTLDGAFRALADPSRREFLTRLAEGPLSVKQLAEPTGISLAAVVQHVQVLEASGLVTSRKTGRTRTCSLRPDGLASVEGWLADRRRAWNLRLDRLATTLDGQAER